MSDRIEAIIDALRKKLLDAAIRGELVDQNDGEEPASALLERIAAERSRLIREKKIKKPKSSSRIERHHDGIFEVFPDGSEKDISGEIPFDIPKSWEWVRLGNYCQYGGVQSSLVINEPQDTWILDLEDIESQTGKILHYIYLAQRKSSSSKYRFSKGMVLYSKLRPYLNKVVVAEKDGYCTTEIVPVKLFAQAVPEYLKIVLTSPEYLLQINSSAYGVKMPRANAELLNSLLIPIPPSDEQHRIVDALERQLKQLDILRESHRRMRRILHETPTSLRQQLLQASIEGKLVAQDPKEEPASALLERIAKERAALPGKRKAVPPSRIERRSGGIFELFPDGSEKDISDEIPFDIPERWEWVRLKQIAEIISGTSYKKKDVSNAGIRILRGDNIQNDSLVLNPDDVFIPASYSSPQKRVMAGDIILVGSTGSKKVIGKAAYIKETLKNTQIGAFLRIVRAYQPCYAEYLAHILATSYYRNYIRALASGTNINNIKAQHLEDFLVPLPPLQEQQRIVQRLEELLPLVSQA